LGKKSRSNKVVDPGHDPRDECRPLHARTGRDACAGVFRMIYTAAGGVSTVGIARTVVIGDARALARQLNAVSRATVGLGYAVAERRRALRREECDRIRDVDARTVCREHLSALAAGIAFGLLLWLLGRPYGLGPSVGQRCQTAQPNPSTAEQAQHFTSGPFAHGHATTHDV